MLWFIFGSSRVARLSGGGHCSDMVFMLFDRIMDEIEIATTRLAVTFLISSGHIKGICRGEKKVYLVKEYEIYIWLKFYVCILSMLFSYGVQLNDESGTESKAFYYNVSYLFSIWFLPPVFLVRIYKALYIKVLQYSRKNVLLVIFLVPFRHP